SGGTYIDKVMLKKYIRDMGPGVAAASRRCGWSLSKVRFQPQVRSAARCGGSPPVADFISIGLTAYSPRTFPGRGFIAASTTEPPCSVVSSHPEAAHTSRVGSRFAGYVPRCTSR